MSKQVFKNPADVRLRVEKEDKDWMQENTENMTEFINEAIREKIEREKIEREER